MSKKILVIDDDIELCELLKQCLDEWFDVWMETCKKNCRDTTRTNYTCAYNRIRASLGWRKLSGINLIIMQQAFNELKTDMSRKDTRRILVDMYNKAMDADLVLKNIPMQVNTVVNKDCNAEEPRVLTIEETDLFLKVAEHYRYYNVFSLALETGQRNGNFRPLMVRHRLRQPSDFEKTVALERKSENQRQKGYGTIQRPGICHNKEWSCQPE